MKIAYLINVYPKPTHGFIRREIAALRALGAGVTVLSIRRFQGSLVTELDRIQFTSTRVIFDSGAASIVCRTIRQVVASPVKSWRGMKTMWQLYRASHHGLLRHLAYFAEACVLKRWLADCHAEHLHVHFGTNSAAAAMICQKLGGPNWSLTIHGPDEFVEGNHIGLREKIAAARFVVGISEFGIQQLRKWTDQADWAKLKLVRCGLDVALLDALVTPVPDTDRIVCVGRLCEQKLQRTLLDALAKLVARNVSVRLTLVGDGEKRAELEEQVDRLGLRSRVTFAGWCSEAEVRAHIENARAMVLPSRDEGLPVAIMEAFALGRPVISTAVAAIPELVEHGQSGWVVPPGDSNALATAIGEALGESTTRLTELANVGRARVRANHSANSNAVELLTLFEHVALSS